VWRAHEIYTLRHAVPGTYQVLLNVFPTSMNCTGATFAVPTATISTNAIGNGRADFKFTPEFVAPFRGTAVPSKEWIALTDGNAWDTAPQWSPDGNLIYFTSTRDGYRCVWAQRLDAARKPSGPAFGVSHFHAARRSPAILLFNDMDLFVARDQILVSLGELTGNIWSVRVSD